MNLERVNEADTLQFGWIDTRSPGVERALALMNTYAGLYQKRMQYFTAQQEAGLGGEAAKILEEQDAMFESMRKEYQKML